MVETTSLREERPKLSAKERLCLIQTINALPPTQFDELVFALDPPKGVVASSTAAQGRRSKDLLDWLEGSSGPGLVAADEVLQILIPKATKTAPQPVAFVISGQISASTAIELQAFVELLRKKIGDNSIDVAFFREGSIKAVLSGSSEGLATLQELFESGELASLETSPIEAIHRIDSNSTDARKARLIQALRLSTYFRDRNIDIVRIHNLTIDLYDSSLPQSHDLVVDLAIALDSYFSRNLFHAFKLGLTSFLSRAQDLARDSSSDNFLAQAHALAQDIINILDPVNCSDIDLREADLSGANLKNINLSKTDMRGANLNNADVTGTIFGDNSGFTEEDKRDLQSRGAIFLDPPSSDVPALVLR